MEKNDTIKPELETQYNILIKAKEKREKRRYIFILIILFITLSSVIVSIYYSYQAFNATKSIVSFDKVKEINTYYQTLTSVFNDGPYLKLSEIGNNYELDVPKVLQITNEGDTSVIFDVKITSIDTSLLSTNNLVYTITSEGETSVSKELPLEEKVIISDIELKAEETKTFIFNVSYYGVLEENNTSNYYNALIEIEQKDNKTDLLE